MLIYFASFTRGPDLIIGSRAAGLVPATEQDRCQFLASQARELSIPLNTITAGRRHIRSRDLNSLGRNRLLLDIIFGLLTSSLEIEGGNFIMVLTRGAEVTDIRQIVACLDRHV